MPPLLDDSRGLHWGLPSDFQENDQVIRWVGLGRTGQMHQRHSSQKMPSWRIMPISCKGDEGLRHRKCWDPHPLQTVTSQSRRWIPLVEMWATSPFVLLFRRSTLKTVGCCPRSLGGTTLCHLFGYQVCSGNAGQDKLGQLLPPPSGQPAGVPRERPVHLHAWLNQGVLAGHHRSRCKVKKHFQHHQQPLAVMGPSLRPAQSFHHLMDIILWAYKAFTAAYSDNVIIHSTTWSGHLFHLGEMLMANPCKCHLGLTEDQYLWYCIGHKETGTCFSGFGWIFIPNLSSIASPLSGLARKGQPATWYLEIRNSTSPSLYGWGPSCHRSSMGKSTRSSLFQESPGNKVGHWGTPILPSSVALHTGHWPCSPAMDGERETHG